MLEDDEPIGLAPLKKIVKCKKIKTIIITATEETLSVSPPHLCIKKEGKEQTIKVDFVVDKYDPAAIELKAKWSIDAPWLHATNSEANPKEEIIVPEGTIAALYPYDIIVDGFGTIDPMITVKE